AGRRAGHAGSQGGHRRLGRSGSGPRAHASAEGSVRSAWAVRAGALHVRYVVAPDIPVLRGRPMHLHRRVRVALVAALLASVTGSGPALADAVALPGSPLAIQVGERGQLQAFRGDRSDDLPPGIFFSPFSSSGDAGFFLAFPADAP